jgi:hypothetical protein
MTESQTKQSQADKFKDAARAAETDDDPRRFDERLAKVVRHKPAIPTSPKPK